MMTTVPPLPLPTTTATATATSSPLGMLPDDQRQIILSYLTCSDLLTLTQVSKAVKNIALRSHILISTTTKSRSNDPIISQQQQQQHNNNNNNEIENEVLSSTSASAATEFMSTNSLRDSIGHMRIEPLLLQRRWTTIATSHNHNNNDNHNHNNNTESLSSSLSLSNSLVQPEQYLLSNPNNNHNHYYHTNHNLHHCWITERNLFQLLQRFTSLRVLKVYNLSSTTSSSISSTSITVPLNSSLDIIHIINTSPCASTLIHIELHSIHLKQYYYNSSFSSSTTATTNKNNNKNNINNEQNIKAVPLQLPKNQNCNIQQLKLSNGIIFCNYNPIIQSFVTDMMNLHTLHLDGLCCISDDEFYKMNNMLFHPNNNNNNGNEENDQLLQRHNHHHHHHLKPKQSKSNLLELSIQNASKLIQPTLQSTSLTKLNMSKCALLTNICNIKCPNLLYIDLSHCQRLKDVVGGNNMINQLLYNCPNLETVLLNTCTSIHNVDIRCNNRLKRLEMNLCSGLESVRIDCKELICLEVCKRKINIT